MNGDTYGLREPRAKSPAFPAGLCTPSQSPWECGQPPRASLIVVGTGQVRPNPCTSCDFADPRNQSLMDLCLAVMVAFISLASISPSPDPSRAVGVPSHFVEGLRGPGTLLATAEGSSDPARLQSLGQCYPRPTHTVPRVLWLLLGPWPSGPATLAAGEPHTAATAHHLPAHPAFSPSSGMNEPAHEYAGWPGVLCALG